MNPDTYENHRFNLEDISRILSKNDILSEDMAACELLADLGDDLSWELIFELAAGVDRKGATGLTLTGTAYEGHWRARRGLRNHLLKAMNHRSPKGEEA